MAESADEPSSFGTSLSLLKRVKMKDDEAWKCLTELYAPLIYHWCRKADLNPDDAADLVQDVFRTLVIHIESFEKTEERGSFRAWLWTITRNRIRDHFRVRGEKAQATGGADANMLLRNLPETEPDDHGDSAVSASGSLAYRAMNTVRGEVKEQTWLAFWRSTMDEIAPAAVAEELGVSIESVWQAKSRVMRRLRELLE